MGDQEPLPLEALGLSKADSTYWQGLVWYMIITTCFVGYHGNGSCNVLQKPGCLKGVCIQNLHFNQQIHVCDTMLCYMYVWGV